MKGFEYYRPETLQEALDLLERGVPLGGGTALTPQRNITAGVIDLNRLGLDHFTAHEDHFELGAGIKLQALVEAHSLPADLRRAAGLEAGWNIRNMATLGGTIASQNGRSPLLTVLLALGARLTLEPGSRQVELESWLSQRTASKPRSIIVAANIPKPVALRYEQVARTPLDRPILCVALCRLTEGEGDGTARLAIGGFGSAPLRAVQVERALIEREARPAVHAAVREVCVHAGDEWASAEYRAHAAAALILRLAGEVIV